MENEKLYDWDELTEEQKSAFIYPSKLKKMPVKKALEYLQTARDGHGYIYTNYVDFLTTLVKKCDIDPEYVFGPDFVENEEEINKHKMNGKQIDNDDLEKKITEYSKKMEQEIATTLAENKEKRTLSQEKEELSNIKKFIMNLKENITSTKNSKKK